MSRSLGERNAAVLSGKLSLLLVLSLHDGNPLPLLHPILYALRFSFALGFSLFLLYVQFAVLFCFGLTLKLKKKKKTNLT